MMNKGLEVIEAARLFGLPSERDRRAGPSAIGDPRPGLLPRRQRAGAARLARTCACRSRTRWPGRSGSRRRRRGSTWRRSARLEFAEPDLERFPALRLARDALRAGGGAPTILNAANEVAVEAFLQRRIGFLDIAGTVARVLDEHGRAAGRHAGRGDRARCRGARTAAERLAPPRRLTAA